MTRGQIAEIDALARKHFTYVPDLKGHDTWRSHSDDAVAGRAWSGDCDDLASTVLDILFLRGMKLADLYRLEVSIAKNGMVDHLIGCAKDEDGNFWIVGDTEFSSVYHGSSMVYEPLTYNRLSEAGENPVIRIGRPWV